MKNNASFNLPPFYFGVIGLDHRHIFDMVRSLLDVGGVCLGYWTYAETPIQQEFGKRFPDISQINDRQQLLDNPKIQLIVCAAIPNERAGLGIEAMQHGKDFMTDKPGITSFAQLTQVKQVQAATGKIFSVNFSERFEVRAVTKATELVRAGAIGKVIQTVGLGPHRLNRQTRSPWFFDPECYGGILVDIASHQIDQFLHFTDSCDANILASRCGNVAHPADPGLQDFGEILLTNGAVSGYIRVDWFTPDGLNTWGDGRLTILGTDGYIELRKYVDIFGRSGKDHLFLVNHQGAEYWNCANEPLPYYHNIVSDIFNRTETAMTHAHCFKVCELALTAQSVAQPIEANGNLAIQEQ